MSIYKLFTHTIHKQSQCILTHEVFCLHNCVGRNKEHSRVKNCGFVTNLWLTKFDGVILYLGYFKQNELPRRFLKSGESSVEPKV